MSAASDDSDESWVNEPTPALLTEVISESLRPLTVQLGQWHGEITRYIKESRRNTANSRGRPYERYFASTTTALQVQGSTVKNMMVRADNILQDLEVVLSIYCSDDEDCKQAAKVLDIMMAKAKPDALPYTSAEQEVVETFFADGDTDSVNALSDACDKAAALQKDMYTFSQAARRRAKYLAVGSRLASGGVVFETPQARQERLTRQDRLLSGPIDYAAGSWGYLVALKETLRHIQPDQLPEDLGPGLTVHHFSALVGSREMLSGYEIISTAQPRLRESEEGITSAEGPYLPSGVALPFVDLPQVLGKYQSGIDALVTLRSIGAIPATLHLSESGVHTLHRMIDWLWSRQYSDDAYRPSISPSEDIVQAYITIGTRLAEQCVIRPALQDERSLRVSLREVFADAEVFDENERLKVADAEYAAGVVAAVSVVGRWDCAAGGREERADSEGDDETSEEGGEVSSEEDGSSMSGNEGRGESAAAEEGKSRGSPPKRRGESQRRLDPAEEDAAQVRD